MTAEQPKRDKQKLNLPIWLRHVLGIRHVEFVSPLYLEQCAKILDLDNKKISLSSYAGVRLHKIDDDTYRIEFDEGYRGMPLVGATGYLKRWQHSTTLITVTTTPSRVGTVIYSVLFSPWFLSALTQFQNQTLLSYMVGFIPPAMIWGFFWFVNREMTNGVKHFFETRLGNEPSS